MLPQATRQILETVPADATVLDIGGWARPFNRADYIIDLMPYETRGHYGSTGGDTERFTKETWINHDVSSSKPLPFKDKELDFAICSHVLEDIRNPIQLCAELNRVAKAGYVEVPARVMEHARDLETPGYCGWYHHRWFVDVDPDATSLTFRFKTHMLNKSWRYQVPRRYARSLPAEQQSAGFFWSGSFSYREGVNLGNYAVAQEMERFVREACPGANSPLRYWLHDISEPARDPKGFIGKQLAKNDGLRALASRIAGRPVGITQDQDFWSDVPEQSCT